MILLSDDQLNSLKITSYERAIVFSSLMLMGTSLIENYSNNITITELINITKLPVVSLLLIKISLPFNKEESLRGIGNFIKNLPPINLDSPDPILLEIAEIPNWGYSEYPLQPIPEWVDSFEEYLFWLITNYQSEMILNNEINYNLISIKTDFNTSKIDIEINIPFDYQKQLIYQNYIVSVLPIYLWGKVLTEPINNSIINNNTIVNNTTLIGN